jgi:hypothetical protein
VSKVDLNVAGAQFYVTHCVVSDSVLNNPGYTVRAASATDSASLEEALRYPPYELPMELWQQSPAPSAAPRRLARTKHPRGVWVAHSAYLPHDSSGRDRSYFSHLLRLPAAEPIEVLRSWGSPGWVTEYPSGAPKVIPTTTQVPVGLLVNEAALTAFLSPTPPGKAELSVSVCPWRLRGSVEARREQFARLIMAVVLLTEKEDNRLFVHTEPGLLALLLYGAVRILPRELVRDLTFTTFEPYHCNIRDFKFARVVGTYLGSPEKNIGDLGGGSDLVLDTFDTTCSSPALEESLPDGLNDLVQLVVTGNWTLLDEIHSVAGGSWDTRAWLVEVGKRVRAAQKAKTPAPKVDPASRDPWLPDRSRPVAATQKPKTSAPAAQAPDRTSARKSVVLAEDEEQAAAVERIEKKARTTKKLHKPVKARVEEEVDVELTEAQRSGGVSGRVWLLGGGLLLLVGGIVAGVALSGGKPKETVQQKQEPNTPAAPTASELPPDKPVPPKDKPTNPLAQPNTVASLAELKVRWSMERKEDLIRYFDLDADGQILVGVWTGAPWSMSAFDARTGAWRNGLEGIPDSFHRLFPLENGKVGFQFSDSDRPSLTVWETVAGGRPRTVFPALNSIGTPSVNVSPNERYIAVGAPPYRPGVEKKFPASQLRVIDVAAKKDAVAINWHVGTTLFTADSSRILVVDNSGVFRWFNLNSGMPDGGWSFGLNVNGINAQEVAISADGRVILYHGQPPGKNLTHHILDGATGNVLYSFPVNEYLTHSGSVSDDGRHVMLLRNDGVGTSHTVELLDVRGKLVASAKFPKDQGNGVIRVRINWKSRTLVVQERTQKLTAYDLPALVNRKRD